jgi:hypothetical protein
MIFHDYGSYGILTILSLIPQYFNLLFSILI